VGQPERIHLVIMSAIDAIGKAAPAIVFGFQWVLFPFNDQYLPNRE
jgi:hypothetical protein